MRKTSRKQSPVRRSTPPAPEADPAPAQPPEPDPGKQSALRVFLDALRDPGPPARTGMGLATRLAFSAVGLGGVISLFVGSAGLPVMEKIVDLLWRLMLLGVADQWVVGLARWIGRRLKR